MEERGTKAIKIKELKRILTGNDTPKEPPFSDFAHLGGNPNNKAWRYFGGE
jgi:hypothetical protein